MEKRSVERKVHVETLIMNEFHNLLYTLSALLLFLILSPKAESQSRVRQLLFVALLMALSYFYIGYEDVDPYLYGLHLIPIAVMLSVMFEGFVTGCVTWLVFNFCSWYFYGNSLLPAALGSTFLLAAGLALYYKGAYQKSFLYSSMYSTALLTVYLIIFESLQSYRPLSMELHVIAIGGTYVSSIIVNYVYYQILMQERLKDELVHAEKNHIVSQLTAAISHEIRNPLTTVRGFLQLMAGKELTLQQRDHYIRYAMEGIDQANGIITDYLSFARPTIERRRPICPHDEIDFILPLIQPLAVLSNIQINWTHSNPMEPVYIMGEAGKLRQILMNLMKNAIESMQGGGTLSVKVDAGETDLCIQIEDTGVGMSEEQIKRIGMPFYTTKEKGTGLGLMVVISLLKTMNGKIEISSKNNQGTLISLKFKRTDPV